MNKRLLLLLLFCLLAVKPAWAGESKAGGLELSGNIDVVTGWQRDDNNDIGTAVAGQLGEFRGAGFPGSDTFNFYIDQVELDVNKSFGENIRIRADLDFGRQLSGSQRNTNTAGVGISNFELEQGYVTLNIKGAELMIGRFNAPVGYYLVDRGDNPTISFSTIFKYLTPTNVTGGKIYYAFNNTFDWHIYVMNSISDGVPFGFASTSGTTPNPGGLPRIGLLIPGVGGTGAIPSYGTRFGFNFGSEDTKSTVGLSYIGGPNRFGCNGGVTPCNAHLTHLIDLDWAVKFTPKFLFAGEGVFRQDNTNPGGLRNDRAFGAFAVFNYDFTDTWRLFFRGGWLQDQTGYYTGGINPALGIAVGQNIYDFALGVGYQITEGAKMKVEYSPTLFQPRGAGGAGLGTSLSHGFALEFAYNF